MGGMLPQCGVSVECGGVTGALTKS
jgi:hypothetical protein